MARITKADVQKLEDQIEELKLELDRAQEWGGEMERKYADEADKVLEAEKRIQNDPLKKAIADLFFYARERIVGMGEVPWQLSELTGLPEKDVAKVFDLYIPFKEERNKTMAQLCETAFTVNGGN